MGPGEDLPATATNFLPSAEEATEAHSLLGALVRIQLWAKAGATAVRRPTKAARGHRKSLFLANRNPSRLVRVFIVFTVLLLSRPVSGER